MATEENPYAQFRGQPGPAAAAATGVEENPYAQFRETEGPDLAAEAEGGSTFGSRQNNRWNELNITGELFGESSYYEDGNASAPERTQAALGELIPFVAATIMDTGISAAAAGNSATAAGLSAAAAGRLERRRYASAPAASGALPR